MPMLLGIKVFAEKTSQREGKGVRLEFEVDGGAIFKEREGFIRKNSKAHTNIDSASVCLGGLESVVPQYE